MSTTYESMVVRFKGLTKAEMIAKYNKNAWGWGTLDKRNAEQAIKDLLSGAIPNEKIVPATIEEAVATLPETLVVKPETKTEEQIFQEELLGQVEEPVVDEEKKDLLDLSGLKTETKGVMPVSPSPVFNAPKKPGRPKRTAGGAAK